MIVFERLHLDHVGLYDETTLELAPQGDGQSAVLIRGHNEYGKTTMFRAFTWVVFGPRGLARMISGDMSVGQVIRPMGAKGTVRSTGRLEFQLNAVTPDGRTGVEWLRLTRTMDTNEDGDVLEVTERLERLVSGEWIQDPARLEHLSDSYLPEEIADLLFMDKDKPDNVVGGAEATHDRSVMVDNVTHAINRLLGIDRLHQAADRVQKFANELYREHANKVADEDLEKANAAVDAAEVALAAAQQRRTELERQIEEAGEQLAARQIERNAAADDEDGLREVRAELGSARQAEAEARAIMVQRQNDLNQVLADAAAWGSAFGPVVVPVLKALNRQHRQGVIPQAQLPLLQNLLDERTNPDQLCICGRTDLHDHEVRARFEELIERSRAAAAPSELLERFRTDLQGVVEDTVGVHGDWGARLTAMLNEYREAKTAWELADQRVREAEAEEERLTKDGKYKNIQGLDKQMGALERSIEHLTAQLADVVSSIEGIEDSRGARPAKDDVLPTKLLAAQRRRSALEQRLENVQKHADTRDAGMLVAEAFRRAAARIRSDQVPQVSASMAELFAYITNNYMNVQEETAETAGDFRTARVGIRPLSAPRNEKFELFAEAANGQEKKLGMLNGASRRALAVSFLLALFEHAGSTVPLVADSLFHSLAGPVKARLAEKIVESAHQSILFFTHDDMLNEAARTQLMAHAGRTYTLSYRGRAELRHPKVGHASTSQTRICTCGPESYCDSCELQDVDLRFMQRQEAEVVN